MKTLLLLALIALVASCAFAQYAEVDSEGGCQQQQVSLSSCRDYVKDRCRSMKVPITEPWKWSQPWKWIDPWKWGMSSCQEVQKRCCQQLEKTESHCRCTAIKQMIEGDIVLRFRPDLMLKATHKAKSLPFMCKMIFMCKTSMADDGFN